MEHCGVGKATEPVVGSVSFPRPKIQKTTRDEFDVPWINAPTKVMYQ
jgi:hypothetical protein